MPTFTCVRRIPIFHQERQRSGCNEYFIASFHLSLPLTMLSNLNHPSVKTIRISRNRVLRPQVNTILSLQRKRRRFCIDEIQNALQRCPGIRYKVFVPKIERTAAQLLAQNLERPISTVPVSSARERIHMENVAFSSDPVEKGMGPSSRISYQVDNIEVDHPH